jgi:hypothetical protein
MIERLPIEDSNRGVENGQSLPMEGEISNE